MNAVCVAIIRLNELDNNVRVRFQAPPPSHGEISMDLAIEEAAKFTVGRLYEFHATVTQ